MHVFANDSSVLFPPVGIAHITRDIADLVRSRMKNRDGIELSCSMQPNSNPHIGTLTTLMTVFAIGEHLSESFGIPALVTFDRLENAPAESLRYNGELYTRSLSDVVVGEESLADLHMRAICSVLEDLAARSGVAFRVRSYSDLQQALAFRKMLLKMLQCLEKFEEVLSPSERRLRVRFPCPVCRLVDKSAKSVTIEVLDEDYAVLASLCPVHGVHKITLSRESSDFVDTNAPIRSALKACVMLEENRQRNFASLIVNGGDWAGVWLQRVYCEAMAALGYDHFEVPMQFFTPIVLDWSGAKLSKTLYVQTKAYDYLPRAFVDVTLIQEEFGESSMDILWEEIRGWAHNPRKLFRNYSVTYLKRLLDDQCKTIS